MHQKGILHGFCRPYGLALAPSLPKLEGVCKFPLCSRVAELKFSGHCAQCVLGEPSDDMTIDVRDREAVLSIE